MTAALIASITIFALAVFLGFELIGRVPTLLHTPLMYVVAAILFVVGIKRLSSPTTARSGNVLAAVGMVIAVVFTILLPEVAHYWLIAAGLAVGAVIGLVAARQGKMTAMPQMVAVFNGLGGGASVLVAVYEYRRLAPPDGALAGDILGAALFSALIGAITFSGSLVAFAKLQELMPGRPLTFVGQQALNGLLLAGALAASIGAGIAEETVWAYALVVVALALGVLFVLPIGGADMPVVIAFLNAFSGLSAVGAGARHFSPGDIAPRHNPPPPHRPFGGVGGPGRRRPRRDDVGGRQELP